MVISLYDCASVRDFINALIKDIKFMIELQAIPSEFSETCPLLATLLLAGLRLKSKIQKENGKK